MGYNIARSGRHKTGHMRPLWRILKSSTVEKNGWDSMCLGLVESVLAQSGSEEKVLYHFCRRV